MRPRLVLVILLLCGLLPAGPLFAQTNPPGSGLSDRQFDALVKAASEAVRKDLVTTSPSPAPGAATRQGEGTEAAGQTAWRERLRAVLAMAPGAPRAAATAIRALLDSGGERPFTRLAAGIVLIFALQLAAVAAIRAGLAPWRRRMLAPERRLGHASRVGILCIHDIVLRGGVLAVAVAAASFWFDGGGGFDELARTLAALPAWWWAVQLLPTVVLRPDDRAHRLVPLGDRVALSLDRTIAALLALRMTMVALLPVLIVEGELPVLRAQALAILGGMLILAATAAASMRLWRLDCAERASAGAAATPGFWRRAWPFALLAIVIVMTLAWTSGVLAVDLSLYDSLVEANTILLAAVILDRIIALLERERAGSAADGDGIAALLRALRRCVRVVCAVVVGIILLRVLAVDRLELIGVERWAQALPALRTATTALVLGYAAWEALRFWVDRRLGPQGPSLPGEDEELEAARSRFDTLLPLLRITGGIAIGVITVLFALTELGINTTPLLAGASILGLAISFGSQSLVRDIVSGVFFMLDDAFRIGDYIDTGRLKGTVEGISLRSIRLRHQNGQVHTIPFGQLQAITNFSRDWATMKFNLRLARDSDIEAVRKAVKKIGQEMLTDPELAREFIQPLKLQGVQEIDETAIVVRCKFTVRPAKPTWVQRQALRRIHEAFPRLGIQFATPSVTVHGAVGETALADAAARQHAVTTARRPASEE